MKINENFKTIITLSHTIMKLVISIFKKERSIDVAGTILFFPCQFLPPALPVIQLNFKHVFLRAATTALSCFESFIAMIQI